MNQNEFRKEIEGLKAYRETRLRLANEVLSNNSIYIPLLDICYEFSNEISCRACWILEFVCDKKLVWLLPHIDEFSNNLHKFTYDSAIRPIAKITQMISTACIHKNDSVIKKEVSSKVLNTIAEANFDWLIGHHKVAVKAYSMRSLYLLGKEFEWIHPELIMILEKEYSNHSAAYKAAARDILKRLKKSN